MSGRLFTAAVCAVLLSAGPVVAKAPSEVARWRAEAQRVTITRDDWGVPHIRGRTDADAVFGMIYAQAEDDFPRIEMNYATNLGRRSLAEGEGAIWSDLRARLYNDAPTLKARYATCPPWLKKLMVAWADGLNFYLSAHKDVRHPAIARFEPWMALSFSEGSIGGDIEDISLPELQSFYGRQTDVKVAAAPPLDLDQQGSNGIAIAPSKTANGHALLLINPHTSFYFRSEAQVTSEEGLNAYGASTWGQFFVYQGFNTRTGWMHTSTGAMRTAWFREAVGPKGGKLLYRYGQALRPVRASSVTIAYRTADGGGAERRFTVYRTHHGPIVARDGERWVSFAMMDKPVAALQQSWLRTKTNDYASFRKVAGLKANSSNNTIFADTRGEIVYMHPHFTPRRNAALDYLKPVDGADPATDWQGEHALSELPTLVNPSVGWLYNSNNWPYSAAGPDSPKPADFPGYMDHVGESARGRHALRLLTGVHDLTSEKLMRLAWDSYQPAWAVMIPRLVAAWEAEPDGPMKARTAEPIAALRGWDYRWGVGSIPQTLAQFWADSWWPAEAALHKGHEYQIPETLAADMTPHQQLEKLDAAVARLNTDFGTWMTPWGEINRFQRLSNDIDLAYDDAKPSIPVGFASSRWGSLAAFEGKRRGATKRYYGDRGNSFVAVVEFGPRIHAIAINVGGQSGHPRTPHFDDQAQRYADGELRPIYFYPDELKGHVERTYRPGE